MSTSPPNSTDMQVLMDWIKRLEDKFDTLSTKLEEKNDNYYARLEGKMDSNYDILEKKINEYIDTSSKNLDSVKDKLQDHEYRLRGVEASTKSTNDKILDYLTTSTEKDKEKTQSFFKKITKVDNIVIIVILVLVFISGKFDVLSQLIGNIFKR